MTHRSFLAVSLWWIPTSLTVAATLSVVEVEPAARSIARPETAIVVHFDKPVVRASIVPRRSLWAFGRWSGTVSGAFEFSDGDATVTLVPDRPFSAGENVMVILSHDIQATDGSFLRPRATRSSSGSARARRRSTCKRSRCSRPTSAAESSRPYGAMATDLDRDGWLDLTIVNEDTSDLRVFRSLEDGSGLYGALAPADVRDRPGAQSLRADRLRPRRRRRRVHREHAGLERVDPARQRRRHVRGPAARHGRHPAARHRRARRRRRRRRGHRQHQHLEQQPVAAAQRRQRRVRPADVLRQRRQRRVGPRRRGHERGRDPRPRRGLP